jgi:hypothetical protein
MDVTPRPASAADQRAPADRRRPSSS